MKRYLLFCGDEYYPQGGMKDLAGTYDTLAEALAAFEDWIAKNCKESDYTRDEWLNRSWSHIYDCEKGYIVDLPEAFLQNE